MPEIILFLLAVFAVGVAVVIGIRAVSDYYATHYSFSIWAGTFILFFAFIILAVALVYNTPDSIASEILEVISLSAIVFVCIQDIRLSTLLRGLAAFILQILIAVSLWAIALIMIARFIANLLLGRRGRRHIQPGIMLGLYPGQPIRRFFTLNIR